MVLTLLKLVLDNLQLITCRIAHIKPLRPWDWSRIRNDFNGGGAKSFFRSLQIRYSKTNVTRAEVTILFLNRQVQLIGPDLIPGAGLAGRRGFGYLLEPEYRSVKLLR